MENGIDSKQKNNMLFLLRHSLDLYNIKNTKGGNTYGKVK